MAFDNVQHRCIDVYSVLFLIIIPVASFGTSDKCTDYKTVSFLFKTDVNLSFSTRELKSKKVSRYLSHMRLIKYIYLRKKHVVRNISTTK